MPKYGVRPLPQLAEHLVLAKIIRPMLELKPKVKISISCAALSSIYSPPYIEYENGIFALAAKS